MVHPKTVTLWQTYKKSTTTLVCATASNASRTVNGISAESPSCFWFRSRRAVIVGAGRTSALPDPLARSQQTYGAADFRWFEKEHSCRTRRGCDSLPGAPPRLLSWNETVAKAKRVVPIAQHVPAVAEIDFTGAALGHAGCARSAGAVGPPRSAGERLPGGRTDDKPLVRRGRAGAAHE